MAKVWNSKEIEGKQFLLCSVFSGLYDSYLSSFYMMNFYFYIVIYIFFFYRTPLITVRMYWRAILFKNSLLLLLLAIINICIIVSTTSMVEKEPLRAKYQNFYWELFLQDCVKKIREDYERDWKSKEMRLRQRFVNNVIYELLHRKRSDVDLDVYKPFVLCLNLNLLYHFAVNNFLFCCFCRGVALYFIDKVKKKTNFLFTCFYCSIHVLGILHHWQ